MSSKYNLFFVWLTTRVKPKEAVTGLIANLQHTVTALKGANITLLTLNKQWIPETTEKLESIGINVRDFEEVGLTTSVFTQPNHIWSPIKLFFNGMTLFSWISFVTPIRASEELIADAEKRFLDTLKCLDSDDPDGCLKGLSRMWDYRGNYFAGAIDVAKFYISQRANNSLVADLNTIFCTDTPWRHHVPPVIFSNIDDHSLPDCNKTSVNQIYLANPAEFCRKNPSVVAQVSQRSWEGVLADETDFLYNIIWGWNELCYCAVLMYAIGVVLHSIIYNGIPNKEYKASYPQPDAHRYIESDLNVTDIDYTCISVLDSHGYSTTVCGAVSCPNPAYYLVDAE